MEIDKNKSFVRSTIDAGEKIQSLGENVVM